VADWLPQTGGLLTAAAGLFTALGMVLTGYAAIKLHRGDDRKANLAETQQALDGLSDLAKLAAKQAFEVERRSANRTRALDEKVRRLEVAVEDAVAARLAMEARHRECEHQLELIRLQIEGKL
jgi:hypothetical protein